MKSPLLRPALSIFLLLLAPAVAAQDKDLKTELLKITNIDSQLSQFKSVATARAIDAVEKRQPDIEPAVLDVMRKIIDDEFAVLARVSADKTFDLFKARFSDDELRQLVAFYDTDAGRKVLAQMPGILREVSALAQQRIRDMGPKLQERFEALMIGDAE